MLSMIWGWTVLACPVAFIAGLVWIRRAKELDSHVDGVPTVGQWVALSLGAVALVVVFGIAILIIGLGHGGASLFSSVALYTIIVGPLAYCVYAYRWISKIRRRLKEQQLDLSTQ